MIRSTLNRVIKTIVRATGLSPDETLDENTPLIGSGISLDSAGVLELLVGLEKEFQIELNPDELLQAQALKTAGTLAGFIDSKANPVS